VLIAKRQNCVIDQSQIRGYDELQIAPFCSVNFFGTQDDMADTFEVKEWFAALEFYFEELGRGAKNEIKRTLRCLGAHVICQSVITLP
jgi:hypothetical protein